MLAETVDARALELSQFCGFALGGFERVQQFAFLRVGRVTQLIDGAADAARFGFFAGGGAERTLAQQQEQREGANQSAAFGGGPIWMRSPMYAPINVNSTPSAESSTYMKAGIVFTV